MLGASSAQPFGDKCCSMTHLLSVTEWWMYSRRTAACMCLCAHVDSGMRLQQVLSHPLQKRKQVMIQQAKNFNNRQVSSRSCWVTGRCFSYCQSCQQVTQRSIPTIASLSESCVISGSQFSYIFIYHNQVCGQGLAVFGPAGHVALLVSQQQAVHDRSCHVMLVP